MYTINEFKIFGKVIGITDSKEGNQMLCIDAYHERELMSLCLCVPKDINIKDDEKS